MPVDNLLYFSQITAKAASKGDQALLTGVFVFWMLLVLVIGIYASKFAKSTEGFFLGDRKMGAWVTSISSSASAESGWLLLGAVGMAYTMGASAAWIAVGCILGFAFNWFFFAEKLRKGTKDLDAITIPEYLEYRVGDKSHLIRLIGVVITLMFMFTYVAAQMTASGKSLQAVFGIDYKIGVLIGGLITVVYTVLGGYRAVSWTDLLQGLLMVVALVVMPIIVIFHLGGPKAFLQKLMKQEAGKAAVFKMEGKTPAIKRIDGQTLYFYPDKGALSTKKADDAQPAFKIYRQKTKDKKLVFILKKLSTEHQLKINKKAPPSDEVKLKKDDIITINGKHKIIYENGFSLLGGRDLLTAMGGRTGLVFLGFLMGMLGIGLGYPGIPHVIIRFMSAKSSKEILQGRVIGMTWATLSLYGAILMGMTGRVLLPNLNDPETAILDASKALLHPVLAGIILAAVISAILSSADSQLLVAASAVCRDVYQKFVSKKQIKEKTMVLLSRLTVFVLGALAIAMALTKNRLVFWFVLVSWAGLGASFGPVLILSLYWKKLSRWGISSGMLTGLLVTIVWKIYLRAAISKATGLDVYELVPAFFLSGLAAIVVSSFTYSENAAQPTAEE